MKQLDLSILTAENEKRVRSASNGPAYSWNDIIPVAPAEFYRDFGLLTHPRTRVVVEQLADYQLSTWQGLLDYKRILQIKSNKTGESTKWLMADFQLAILPSSHPMSCMGYDQLVIAQTKDHAKEHLRTLRKMIIDSTKYNKYLINKPSEISENAGDDVRSILKDEQTKTSVIYLYNPENPSKPSRIIALGIENDGAILSWKNIKNIHMSDITAVDGDNTPGINAAMTRLANTDGSMIIETIPGDPKGRIFEMYQQYNDKEWKTGAFKVYEITADDGVRAGIITPEFLEGERTRLGIMYPRYYQARFMQGAGNIFPYDLLKQCFTEYSLAAGDGYKGIGIDPAYGSSKFGIVAGERINGTIYIKQAEQFERASPSAMLERLVIQAPMYSKNLAVDSAHPGLITDLKDKGMSVRAVEFNKKLSEMTIKAAEAVKTQRVKIHPTLRELISQLTAATFNEKGHPDKKKLNFDLGDAFLMLIDLLDGGEIGYAVLEPD